MTDHYDELSVSPDPALAEELRQRLHAHVANASLDELERQPHLQLDTARLDTEQDLVPVKETYMSIDSPPTSDIRNRRRLAMAAAAVVAVVGVAAIAINSMNSDDNPDPAPAAPPMVASTTVAPTTIAPTTETVQFAVGAANDIPVTFTAPVDWTVADGFSAYKVGAETARPGGAAVGVLFDGITNIYAEGCQWVPADPPVGPTVDDLVQAWANAPELAATAAVDVTVDGYSGKQIEITAPDYNPGECKEGKYGLWHSSDTGGDESRPGYWAQAPNQHLKVWVLDVDGTRLVIGAGSLPGVSAQDRAALENAVASIQIG
jgi:hypothetical protein